MRGSCRRKLLNALLCFALVTSVFTALAPAPAAAAAIEVLVLPETISIWGMFDVFPLPNFSPGPGYATIVVRAPSTATVTVNAKTVFDHLFPTAASRVTLLPQALRDAFAARMTAMSASPFTWNAALGAWTHQLGTEYPISEPGATVRALAETVLFQDAVLGDVTVPVRVDATTYNVTVTVVDMQRPMLPGWNAVSTPAALGVSKWGDITKLGDNMSYDAAVRWDAVRQAWATVKGTDNLQPLEGVYVHATSFTTLGLIFSRGTSAPPTRTLRKGWNLVAPAVVQGQDASGDDAYFQVPAGQMLRSLGDTYTNVVSPGDIFTYTQSFTNDGQEVDTYDWDFTQQPWVYAAGAGTAPQAVAGGGYWVYAQDALGTLVGTSQTPIRISSWNPF